MRQVALLILVKVSHHPEYLDKAPYAIRHAWRHFKARATLAGYAARGAFA